jgi:hypothetical protein
VRRRVEMGEGCILMGVGLFLFFFFQTKKKWMLWLKGE